MTTWKDEIDELLRHYPREFSEGIVTVYSSRETKEVRDGILRKDRKKKGPRVVLASTSLVDNSNRANSPLFPVGKDSGMFWDCVVVDEVRIPCAAKKPQRCQA